MEGIRGPSESPNALNLLPPSVPYNSFLHWQQTLITERSIFVYFLPSCVVDLTVSCMEEAKW